MKNTIFWNSLKALLVLCFICNFTYTAIAQNYYPAVIGNEWVLDGTNNMQRITYSLEQPEDMADQNLTLLKIETKNSNTDSVFDTDKYFMTVDEEALKLHKTELEFEIFEQKTTVSANFPTPVSFFPLVLEEGDEWQIPSEITVNLFGTDIALESTSDFEVVDFEDVVTPSGTFRNCAKVKLTISIISAFLNVDPTTSYQWLAPDIGPVKYEDNDGKIFEIVSFKKFDKPVVMAENGPVWQLPSLTFQVSGSRLGNILNAKILENVEDYVSEVHNLGIVRVTGNIVRPGDGTGFATNLEKKQDLWVAGNFDNAPIIGTITLFAENNIDRTLVTITVTINVR